MDNSSHRSVNYRTKAIPRSVLRPVLRREQAKLYLHFARTFTPRHDWKVLDLGTNGSLTDKRDYFFHERYPYPTQITAAGLESPSIFQRVFPNYKYVQVQRGAPLPFEDKAFDLLFCNAVIEHAGSRALQRSFLAEVLRVAHRVFITTPNRWHPIEFHTVTPLLHYLPVHVYRRIYASVGFEFFSKEENLNLLDAEELLDLLPTEARTHAVVRFHRFLGLKSNILLSVGPRPQGNRTAIQG